ncbi:MAG: hypothetical protein JNM40_21315 [Myxococcales bacterium]|nr:hypothetical protein [Myxococcales bacterium]
MPRPKAPPRVTGPYAEREGTRFRIRVLGQGSAKNLYFPTWDAALAGRAQAEQQLQHASHQQVGELIDAFFAERARSGLCRPATLVNEQERLRDFLGSILDEEVQLVSAAQADAIYQATMHKPSPKTGKPLEAASHRFYLGIAKRFFAWVVQQGILPSSPFREVRPQGRPKAGKPQLRVEEAHRFLQVALRLFDEERDVLALAAMVSLLLGLRAREVLACRVSDVSADGCYLTLPGGRSGVERPPLKVPLLLQKRLQTACQDKEPGALVFGQSSQGGPRHHRMLWSAVGRICEQASVPRVCTHSLRGLWTRLSLDESVLSDVVAARLGHGTATIPISPSLPSVADDQLAEQQAVSILATLSPLLRAKLLTLLQNEQQPSRSPPDLIRSKDLG